MKNLELIKEAYSNYWDLVKDFVDEDGYIGVSKREDRFDDLQDDIEMEGYFDYEEERAYIRPITLKNLI